MFSNVNLVIMNWLLKIAKFYVMQNLTRNSNYQKVIMSKCVVHVLTISQNPWGLALLSHCYYLSGDLDRARKCYESVKCCVLPSPMLHVILLRLADIYMKEKKVSWLVLVHTACDRVEFNC